MVQSLPIILFENERKLNLLSNGSNREIPLYEGMKFTNLWDLVFWKWWGIVGDFQNNGMTLEPKVVTLHGNHSYTLEH